MNQWEQCKSALEKDKADSAAKHERRTLLAVLREWKRAMPKIIKENMEVKAVENRRVYSLRIVFLYNHYNRN